jgi:Fe-S-cluster-containing dehydrogenase component
MGFSLQPKHLSSLPIEDCTKRSEIMPKYALTIGEAFCWGCKTCEVACKQENKAADSVKLIAVWEDGPQIVAGKLDVNFRVAVCRHCDEPPCADVCPAEAIAKRPDGIVVLDPEACTGCGACLESCPYHAIAFDPQKGTAQKCNLCHHRVDRGLLPACADNVCPAHCILFGDVNEIDRRPMGVRTVASFQTNKQSFWHCGFELKSSKA